MLEEEMPQKLKFTNGKVTVVNCPHTLVAIYADSNICLQDHRDIICSVSNG